MKKHDEGYTLPLVMVVLLVLSIVAVTIMTTSLKNMQRQQSFIEQMQDQYKAQGQIEAVVAQLENAADASAVTAILTSYAEGNTSGLVAVGETTKITAQSTYGSVCIDCIITLELNNGSKNNVSYTEYSISTVNKGGGS